MFKRTLGLGALLFGLVACGGGDYGANLPFAPDPVIPPPPPAPTIFLVSNADSNDISVIDASDLSVTTLDCSSLTPPCIEPRNLAVSHDGASVYVPLRHSNGVAMLSTDPVVAISGQVIDSGLDEPYAVTFTSDDAQVWVANKGGSSVTVIDAASGSVVETIADECFWSPEGIVVANGKAYVANRNGGSVCVVDVATRSVLSTIAVGGDPRYAVATPDGAFVYVAIEASGVAKIRTSDDTVVTTIAQRSRNLAASPDGTKIYVGTQGNSIGVINVATDALTQITVSTASSIYGVAVSSDGRNGFATDESRNVVYRFDPATDTVINASGGAPLELGVGSTPRAFAAL